MRWSVAAMFGTAIELAGAFTIGGVIHQSVVQNAYPLYAPAPVFGMVVGLVLIVVGRRLGDRFEPAEYVPGSEEEAEDDDEMEFDEDLSPVPTERLEEREADETADVDEE